MSTLFQCSGVPDRASGMSTLFQCSGVLDRASGSVLVGLLDIEIFCSRGIADGLEASKHMRPGVFSKEENWLGDYLAYLRRQNNTCRLVRLYQYKERNSLSWDGPRCKGGTSEGAELNSTLMNTKNNDQGARPTSQSKSNTREIGIRDVRIKDDQSVGNIGFVRTGPFHESSSYGGTRAHGKLSSSRRVKEALPGGKRRPTKKGPRDAKQKLKGTVMKAENTLKRKDLNPRLSYSQNHPFQVPPEGQASKEHQKVGGRASRTGFDDLDPKSMDSYEELSQKLLEEFSQKKRYAKDPTEVHGIKMRLNKGLQGFMDHFKSKSSHIRGVPPVLRISAFMHGHGNLKLAKKLNDKIPKTVDEMFERV
ncbi:hypothetical protein Tco_0763316 [Tanacetum coccineum]